MKNQAAFVATGFCVVVAAIALGLFVYSSNTPGGIPLPDIFPKMKKEQLHKPEEEQPPKPEEEQAPKPEEEQPPKPEEDEKTVDEGINLVRVAPDGTGMVAGLAPPGSKVDVKSGDAVIGAARSSGQGDWGIALDPPLEPGSHLLHVEIVTPEGEARVGGLAAVIELAGRNEPLLVALVPYAAGAIKGGATPKLFQGPGAEEEAARQQAGPGVNIRTIQTSGQGTQIQVAGDALGGAAVTLEVNGDTAPAVAVSENAYAVEAGLDPAAERHRLKVALLDADGAAIASARVALTRSKIEQTFGNDSLVVVQKGDALWHIAYRTYGDGYRYVTIFEKNKKQIANADLIYPDQIFVVPGE